MSEVLNNLMVSGGSEMFYTPEYMHFIRTHLKYIKENGTSSVDVKRGLINQFEYNFYSLLTELKYPNEDFIPILLVNGLNDPSELTMAFGALMLPNPEVLSALKQLYRHQNKRV